MYLTDMRPNILYTARYPVFGRIIVRISGIRPDIQYSAGYLAVYLASSRIFGRISGIRLDIGPYIRYPDSSVNVDMPGPALFQTDAGGGYRLFLRGYWTLGTH